MNTIHPKQHKGFTLVELLIIIVIIGILAAISMVAYNGVMGRANDATVQQDLKQLATKLEMYRAENSGYPGASGGINNNLSSLGFKASKSSYYIISSNSNLGYCFQSDDNSIYKVIAKSKSGKNFYISSSSNSPQILSSFSCTVVPSMPSTDTNYMGYNSTDTTTGPWRAWAGGN